ncbi:MAG: conjugal transfer protein TraH [Rickettsiaceae bacterium]|nr:conjugal transfer protein TraH [Rickettsiaceae bacterium]
MNNNKVAIICLKMILFITIFLPASSYAGLDALMKFASPDGSLSNLNSPEIIKDQTGGYMSAGSILLRGPRPNELTPFYIKTPKLKFDACTGSGDFRFGAFSYISGREFSSFLKKVAQASGAYLVKMSIKSACPQCEDIMTYLETVARDINSMTLNQCSLSQSIAEGAFSRITSSEKQHCMMESNETGSNRDMFQTTTRCADSAGERILKSDGEFESMLGDEFNLVWKALSKGEQSSAISGLKELMMSISGTITRKKEDGRFKFASYPSLIVDKELLEKYIGLSTGSSNVSLYSCDENHQCINPAITNSNLSQNETLYGNVSRIMRNLTNKIRLDDHNLTDEETSLISFSSIPIINLIETELATKANPEDMLVRVSEFIEVVCFDVITNFMQVMLNKVMSNVQSLEHAQIDSNIIRNFLEDSENIRKYLQDSKFASFQKLQVITQVKKRLEQQVAEFNYKFGDMMKTLED